MAFKAGFVILFVFGCFLAIPAGADEASDILMSDGAAHDIDQKSDLIEDKIEDAAQVKKDSPPERSLEQKAESIGIRSDMMRSAGERD